MVVNDTLLSEENLSAHSSAMPLIIQGNLLVSCILVGLILPTTFLGFNFVGTSFEYQLPSTIDDVICFTEPVAPFPLFVMLGPWKTGTTTLRYMLDSHPCLVGSKEKAHFLSQQSSHPRAFKHQYFHQMLPWTAAHKWFPNVGYRAAFEAGASYFFEPKASTVIDNVKQFLPKTRLVASFREPIAAMFSRYRMQVDKREHAAVNRSFEEWVQHNRFYDYASNLQTWTKDFPFGDRLMVVSFEQATLRPNSTMNNLYSWLGLPAHVTEPVWMNSGSVKNIHVKQSSGIDRDVYYRLVEKSRPMLRKLYQLTGVNFGWEEQWQYVLANCGFSASGKSLCYPNSWLEFMKQQQELSENF